MSVEPVALYPPQPSTTRAHSTFISYDKINNRIAYAMGRSIFVKSIDSSSSFQFTKHTSPTTVAAFSPNGNYIASGDESGQVKIWDLSVYGDKNPLKDTPIIKGEYQILSGPIKAISWDGDGTRIITVGEGKEKFGHCFSWDSGNSVGEIQGHSDVITAVAIKSQRPFRAATVGNDKALVFYTGPPFKFSKSIRDYHTNIIRDVEFSPDGKYLVSVGSDRLVVIYDGKTGDFITKIEAAHEGGIFGVAWFDDSAKFATCSSDNTVKIWLADDWKCETTFKVEDTTSVENQLVGLVVAGTQVIALSLNGNLNYFDSSLTVVKGHQSAITASVVVDGVLITGGADGRIFKWTSVVPTAIKGHGNYVVDMIYEDGKLFTIGWDDKLKVWDLSSGDLLNEVVLGSQPKKLVSSSEVLFENGLKTFVDGQVKQEKKLSYDASDVDKLADTLLVTNINDSKLEAEGDLKFDAIRGSPSVVRVSPDGKYIALGDSTGKYIVYNADGSLKTSRWVYHTGKVVDAKWSHDSKFLLSGGLDSSITIYSIDKISRVLQSPLAHQSGISRVEWLELEGFNGKISTTGFDGAVKIWDIDLSNFK